MTFHWVREPTHQVCQSIVAAWSSDSQRTGAGTVGGSLSCAQDRIGSAAIAHGSIAAVERRPPARVPEVLVSRVDAPGGGQLDVGRVARRAIDAAVDAIAQNTKSELCSILLEPVRGRGLEDVLQRAFGVVDLGLQVVALADHRSVQLDARADREAQFVIGMREIGRERR